MVSSVLVLCPQLIIFRSLYLLIGLIGHLQSHFKPLFNLYTALKGRNTPPSADEIAFASGSKEFTGQDQAEYLKAIEVRASTLASAFLRQEHTAMVCPLACFHGSSI
jgi:hypothetical protein